MRRLLVLPLALAAAGCGLVGGPPSPPPSPYCRQGDPLYGVYHPDRLLLKKRCAVATGTVQKVKFEPFDGDVHIDLRPDPEYAGLLSAGNDRVGGNLVVEIIPQDRLRVVVPDVGARISVVGPYVDDTTHDWREIHPAWWVSSGRIVPPTPAELARVVQLLRFGGHGEGE